MLTVKHVAPDGSESIYLASEVRYDPAMDNGVTGRPPQVWIDTPKNETRGLGSFGSFFIMTDAGKTVQRYDLGGWTDAPGVPASGLSRGASEPAARAA